jgi:hypothetical protein
MENPHILYVDFFSLVGILNRFLKKLDSRMNGNPVMMGHFYSC